MITYKEADIKLTMLGATLFASGGGGSYADGITLLDNFKRSNPSIPISVRLYQNYEIAKIEYAAIIAGIGAPTEQEDQDFSPCAISCFQELTDYLAPRVGKQVVYALPVEMGGFNTLVPMLVAMKNNTGIIDVDGAGRAVPTLNTTLMELNGISPSPVALTDDKENVVDIIAQKGSTEMFENISRVVSEEFRANASVGGWIMDAPTLAKMAVGTVSRAKDCGDIIASVMNDATKSGNKGEYIVDGLKAAGVDITLLCARGQVTQFSSAEMDGFDIGGYMVSSVENKDEVSYQVKFQNENILLYQVDSDYKSTIYMTAPDIISLIDNNTGMPLTNEDLAQIYQSGKLESLNVALVKIKVCDNWWENEEATEKVWKPVFENLGYKGSVVKY